MSSIIKTLHCFSKGSEGRQAPFPPRLSEKIVPHLKADDMEVAVLATLTYSNVASQGQKRLLEVDSRVCFLHSVIFFFFWGGGGEGREGIVNKMYLAMSTFKTALPFVLEDEEILYLRHVYWFR